ncbi:MAG: DUF3823 domain-containing protein [Sphingobacteriales bacterium]|nr:MAG: DUF3823 domain-containing protein [Sphingobacteriales bacterium]
MKSKIIFSVVMVFVLFITGCTKDNKSAPNATISGRVIYDGQPLEVRSNGVQLELWQPGYQLFSKIPVHVNQDGTYSAKVFNGSYRLTLLRGNGPWADKTDSILVDVNGTANIDVPVDPYFIIKNAAFTRSGNTVNASFTVQRVNTTRALELVRLYIGQTIVTDQTNNAASAQKTAAAIPDLTQTITLSATIPASLASKDYVYVRLGVKAVNVAELLYSPSQQVMTK